MIDCIALALLSLMVQTESGFEPLEGKIAVAYVAVNRAEALLTAPWCEGCDDRLKLLVNVLQERNQFAINPRAHITESSYYAAWVALNRLQPDPTHGADHFYNDTIRPWPSWYDERYRTVKIGHHSFLKLGGF